MVDSFPRQKVTPYELVYGQEAVLPVEVNSNALRIAKQNDLSAVDFYNLMMDNIDEVADKSFCLAILKAFKFTSTGKTAS